MKLTNFLDRKHILDLVKVKMEGS